MKVMGIDLALRNTGLVLIDLFKGDVIKSENIVTKKEDDWISCVSKIETKVEEYLNEADMVYMENYSFNASHGREVLGEVGGVVKKLIVEKTGHLPRLVPPLTLKLFATGKGRVPACPEGEVKSTWGKRWTMEKVKQNFGQDFDTDHETDAFVAATIGRILYLVKKGKISINTLPEHQQRVITKLLEEEKKNGKDDVKSGGFQ